MGCLIGIKGYVAAISTPKVLPDAVVRLAEPGNTAVRGLQKVTVVIEDHGPRIRMRPAAWLPWAMFGRD
jgi:hypothetical protein